jgi:lysine 6-dehydrogenase
MTQTFRYGVLGSGMQGTAAGYDLALHGGGRDVLFLDREAALARRAADRVNALLGRAVARAAAADARDEDALFRAFEGLDGVLSAVPYPLNPRAARAAVRARASFNDLGGNTDVVRQELALDREAKAAGVSVVPDCGLAPGLGNILAAHLVARRAPHAKSIQVRCGGLPQKPRPPLGYKLVFNVGGLTNEYSGEAEYLRGGRIVRVPTLGEIESLEFPQPVGRVEAFVTSGGTSTAPATFQGTLDSYDYKTVRYPGHAEKIRLLADLGFLDEAPVAVNGAPVVPREVLHALLVPRLTFPEDKDLVVLRVRCAGGRSGAAFADQLDLLDFHDDRTGFSAMERTTAFPAAACLHFQVLKRVPPGALPPEKAFTSAEYVDAVRSRGLAIEETVS